ncbi:ATP-binding cassette domain-containing protein [Deefgea sp. CFH1-16]|uniref:ABC transporter ATP-binding protein n=1 Tax=Deefgea sp. CFH1-16 TaxID=2675457 RepID=UPI0027DB095F|nr:ATP-binding cassette domain-containing protein [Deefgea sp. CFH1-16]
MNLLEFQNVSFSYAENQILRDVSLSIRRGQLVAIMGGSGSGKTTLLKLIGGQLQAQQGAVWLDGQNVGQLNEHDLYQMRRKLGMLFQFGALFTDLSVFDNVAFPLRERTQLPESMIQDLVLMKLEAVGLRGAAQQMPHELSGGMARRVAFGARHCFRPCGDAV